MTLGIYNNFRFHRPNLCGCIWIVILIVVVALCISVKANADSNFVNEEKVKLALLDEEWENVFKLLRDVNEDTPSSVARLIKGHACLVLNKNNSSIELFASALNDADLEPWQIWTEGFAKQNTKNAIAMYLIGDAHARRKEWMTAGKYFEKALRLDPQCYLAWNARGVVSHGVGNTLMARQYFLKASTAKEDFSDAYSNRGSLNIFSRSVKNKGVTGPEASFIKAREYSQDENSLLPMLGLGCVHYGRQEHDKALNCFSDISKTSYMYTLAQLNIFMIAQEKLDIAVKRGNEVGMAVKAQILNSNLKNIAKSERINEDEFWREQILRASKLLEHLRNQYNAQCAGAAKDSNACKKLADRIKELEEAIDEMTKGKVKNKDNKKDINRLLNVSTDSIRLIIDRINDEMPRNGKNIKKTQKVVGGVDADVRGLRTNRGQWTVSTVYGLLYPVQGRGVRPEAKKD
ncbi:MAG: hypothetical protein GY797_27015 [Deltaproteobacteria bacterium]|nr:hypothetical protein [Deltaproteobacteria bacterium]